MLENFLKITGLLIEYGCTTELYIKNFRKRISKYHSQYGEDREIGKFFEKKSKGYYFDIGCFHPIRYSNTFYLFKKGWQGTNIDVNQNIY